MTEQPPGRPGDQSSPPELEFVRRWRPMIDRVGGDGGQARAAKHLNWTTSTVSRDYKGETLPTDERLFQLGNALQLPHREMLDLASLLRLARAGRRDRLRTSRAYLPGPPAAFEPTVTSAWPPSGQPAPGLPAPAGPAASLGPVTSSDPADLTDPATSKRPICWRSRPVPRARTTPPSRPARITAPSRPARTPAPMPGSAGATAWPPCCRWLRSSPWSRWSSCWRCLARRRLPSPPPTARPRPAWWACSLA